MRKADAAGLFGLIACLAIGVASLSLGAASTAGLAGIFQPDDILHDEGPDLFQAWLARRVARGDLSPEAISRRVLRMPIAARRETVNAMMAPQFGAAVTRTEAQRRRLLQQLEEGLIVALGNSPSAGELWLAAAKIRTQTIGFDQQAEDYLAASYLMAPRAGALVRSRLVFAASVEPFLRVSLDEERGRDRANARKLYPHFERGFAAWQSSLQQKRTETRPTSESR